jgi:multiple sugar transport system permease protein
VLAALAAYPLSRFSARYNSPLLYTILFASSLPITAIMVPVYALFVQLQLVDSQVGVTLFMAATGLPYAIWMMKNFMDAVPIVLEEAAWTEGASMFGTLWRVVLPLMGPGITAIFIFNFIEFWGNFFVPFVLLLDPAKLPISVSIYNFFGSHGTVVYGQLAAFALIYTVPVIVLYLLVSRSLNGAFRLEGGVKG